MKPLRCVGHIFFLGNSEKIFSFFENSLEEK